MKKASARIRRKIKTKFCRDVGRMEQDVSCRRIPRSTKSIKK